MVPGQQTMQLAAVLQQPPLSPQGVTPPAPREKVVAKSMKEAGVLPKTPISSNINVMVPPGTLLRDYHVAKEVNAAFSSMSKSDKLKASNFVEVMRDTAALELAILNNYIRKVD